ncbi:hypothetical protein F4808DRAFT_134180 [Astrocystis sublimbata]|nr:hypothetical protein F4808DRAFT_134180 [Astrocystis sublimbata]
MMLAARGQENVAASHQHGAALKQQQGLAPKTPGLKNSKTPMKVPLNDENGARTGKAFNAADKANFATPMTQRARAVLGNKTTNAKAKGLPQTGNVKGVIRDIEQSNAKLQNTVRQKQRDPQAETHKLQVHAEEADPLSEDEIEYCPPRPKDLPYESDVFPDGVLTFDALKPENRMRGYYQYYFNPIGDDGLTKRDRELQEETRKAIQEGERKIRDDIENMEWSIKGELEPKTKPVRKTPTATSNNSSRLPAPPARKALSTVRSRNAANALSMDDSTKSLQRKVAKTSELSKPAPTKATSSFGMPALRTVSRPGSQLSSSSAVPKKSASELEATSRTTIGYNRGRATASLLNTRAKTPTNNLTNKPSATTATAARRNAAAPAAPTTMRRGGFSRSNTTLSNDSDKTITPARWANRQQQQTSSSTTAEDEDNAWRERVPFLSIFNPGKGCDDGEEDEDVLGIRNRNPAFLDDEEEEFELKIVD